MRCSAAANAGFVDGGGDEMGWEERGELPGLGNLEWVDEEKGSASVGSGGGGVRRRLFRQRGFLQMTAGVVRRGLGWWGEGLNWASQPWRGMDGRHEESDRRKGAHME